jgi:GT2 family glycosyltransferase
MSESYSVITIGYKSLKNIINRINEVYDGPNPPNEFILIINYYSEESWDILDYAKKDNRITRFVFCSQNIGFAKAINLGGSISKSDN